MDETELLAGLALNRITTPAQRTTLLRHWGSPKTAVEALRDEDPQGHPLKSKLYLLQPKRLRQLVEPDLRWLEGAPDRHVLVYAQPLYPPLLFEIDSPPAVLYVRGNVDLLSRPQLAIVGSRRATPYGLAIARSFAKIFSQNEFIVTSGMALGIDGAAQSEVLSCDKPTVAVFGTPVDRCFPRRHSKLAEDIAAQGALVSEQPLNATTRFWHFSTRNRIISGLCLATLVVEASSSSGSLITARYAAEQGREVFAVPGPVHSPNSQGCHQLIREGSVLVEHPGQVLEQLGTLITLPQVKELPLLDAPLPELNANERTVLKALGSESVSFDALMELCTGLNVQELGGSLNALEAAGLVAFYQGRYEQLPNAAALMQKESDATEKT